MRRAFAILVATLAVGCSVVVDPGDAPGGCVPTSDRELCGGGDEDCDGLVDEGHDVDMDGFTWCGGGGEVRPLADCDDSDPEVHPGNPAISVVAARERCDGKDNDCDGLVDEEDTSEPGLCPEGQQCIDRVCVDPGDCSRPGYQCPTGQRCDIGMSPPRCVSGGGCNPSVPDMCPAGQVCEPDSRTCIVMQPLGEPCTVHAECESEHCVPADAAGLTTTHDRICAKPCCSDGDCPDSSLCWASGGGARLCIRADLLGLERGSGGPASSCGGSSECASGICMPSGECLGNCASNASCSSGETCGIADRFDRSEQPDFTQLACTTPIGSRQAGEFCLFNSDCQIGTCWGALFCSGPCGTQPDCSSSDAYCGYGWLDSDSGRRDWVQICVPRTHSGRGRTGDTCSEDDDCLDRACVRDKCADTCCVDTDCDSTRRCRPVRAGSRYEMHCVE